MISLTIDSVERADKVIWNSLSRDDRVNNQPDTLVFKLRVGGSQTYKPTLGDEVILEVNGDKEFGGNIVRIKQKAISAKQVEYSITCQDYMYQMNANLVTERYTDTTAQAVIEDLIDNYTTGFTYNNVNATGISIESISFNRLGVADCIEKLARLSSYSWYVDYNKDLHFNSKNIETAPFILTDDENHTDYGKYEFKSLELENDLSQLRNLILVEGGEKTGELRTVTKMGSALSEEGVLELSYKFSEKPTVTVDSVAQTVGVDFLNDEGSFDCLWSFQEKYIRFTTGNIPTSGQEIVVTGTPLFPIIVRVPDPLSISLYGERQFVVRDDTIRSDSEAIERALAELRAYGNAISSGSFVTQQSGLRAGQTLSIVDTLRGIDEQVVIQAVKLIPTDPLAGVVEYKVSFATLKDIGIIEFLQRQLLDEEIEENEVESLLSFLQLSDTSQFTDTLDAPVTRTTEYKWADSVDEFKWNLGVWH